MLGEESRSDLVCKTLCVMFSQQLLFFSTFESEMRSLPSLTTHAVLSREPVPVWFALLLITGTEIFLIGRTFYAVVLLPLSKPHVLLA